METKLAFGRKVLCWVLIVRPEYVWGIGRQYAAKLTAASVETAADLARVSDAWARKHLGGVVGARLVEELKGRPCTGLHPSEDGTLSRQSLSCSRSFSRLLTAFSDVSAVVATFLSRAAEKLRSQGKPQSHSLGRQNPVAT